MTVTLHGFGVAQAFGLAGDGTTPNLYQLVAMGKELEPATPHDVNVEVILDGLESRLESMFTRHHEKLLKQLMPVLQTMISVRSACDQGLETEKVERPPSTQSFSAVEIETKGAKPGTLKQQLQDRNWDNFFNLSELESSIWQHMGSDARWRKTRQEWQPARPNSPSGSPPNLPSSASDGIVRDCKVVPVCVSTVSSTPRFASPSSSRPATATSARVLGFQPPNPAGKVPVMPMTTMLKDSDRATLAQIDSSADEEEGCPFNFGTELIQLIPRWVPLFLGIGAVLGALAMIAMTAWLSHVQVHNEIFVIFTTLVYGLAGSVCISMLQSSLQRKDLSLALACLRAVMANFKAERLAKTRRRKRRLLFIAWLLLICTQVVSHGLQWYLLDYQHGDGFTHVHDLVFKVLGCIAIVCVASGSGLILSVAYVQSGFISGLDAAIDCWCNHMLTSPDFEFGVQSWANMEAMLKSVARELGKIFVLIHTFSSVGLIYLLANSITYLFRMDELLVVPTVAEGLASLPLFFLFSLSMWLFGTAAALTEKCNMIPSFVNKISSQETMSQDKSFLVNFIQNSNAGFFVGNVKLTQETFVKQLILVCGLLSGLFGTLSRIRI